MFDKELITRIDTIRIGSRSRASMGGGSRIPCVWWKTGKPVFCQKFQNLPISMPKLVYRFNQSPVSVNGDEELVSLSDILLINHKCRLREEYT